MFKISLSSQRTLPEDTVSSAKTKETIQDVELQEDQSTKRLKHTENLFRKKLLLQDVC